jgi:hypothetical protein
MAAARARAEPDLGMLLGGEVPPGEIDFDDGAGDLDALDDELGDLDGPEAGTPDDLLMGAWEAIKADDFEGFRDSITAAVGALTGGALPR